MIDQSVIGISMLILMLIFCFTSVHIAWGLASVGLLGMMLVGGFKMIQGQMGEAAYAIISSYDLATIPLFILMGQFAAEAGIGRNAFDAARMWIGRLRGGLAMAATVASAAFGAASGSTTASSALFAKIAYPEMVRHGYDKGIASGCVAASGTMAGMIPPSITLLIYGIVAQQSLGKLLVAGILPGCLEAATYMLMIYIRGRINPDLLPIVEEKEKISFKTKLVKTGSIFPIIIIFFFAIGGVFFGIFTPTEGGAMGAAGALIVVLLMRRLSKKGFLMSLKETVVTAGMIMMVIFGGYFFSRMLVATGLMQVVTKSLLDLPLSSHLIFLGAVILLIFAGMVMVPVVMIVIFVPILLPPFAQMGYDPIWFGIMFTRLIELACITPPIALNIYVVKVVIGKDIEIIEVIRGVIWFIGCDILNLCILYFVPQIATWLPGVMFS